MEKGLSGGGGGAGCAISTPGGALEPARHLGDMKKGEIPREEKMGKGSINSGSGHQGAGGLL